MLEFYYDFLDKYIDRRDFELIQMDTDSNYMAISSERLEDIVRPELKQEFEVEKNKWLAWDKWSGRTQVLFKLECEGSRMIALCSKCYYVEGEKNMMGRNINLSLRQLNANVGLIKRSIKLGLTLQNVNLGLVQQSIKLTLTLCNVNFGFIERSVNLSLIERNVKLGLRQLNVNLGLIKRSIKLGLTLRNANLGLVQQSIKLTLTLCQKRRLARRGCRRSRTRSSGRQL